MKVRWKRRRNLLNITNNIIIIVRDYCLHIFCNHAHQIILSSPDHPYNGKRLRIAYKTNIERHNSSEGNYLWQGPPAPRFIPVSTPSLVLYQSDPLDESFSLHASSRRREAGTRIEQMKGSMSLGVLGRAKVNKRFRPSPSFGDATLVKESDQNGK